jgi:Na+/H+ antiporter NhaD/arsenite permease-like protein
MSLFVVCVFAMVYLGMALGRLPGLAMDRSGIAFVGAALMLAAGALPAGEWAQVLDLETLLLLFALMLVGAHFAAVGAFDAVASALARSALSPYALLGLTVATGGVLSAVLVNDIVVFALTPMLARGLLARGLMPAPYLLALALASNAGSAATLVGNPQNLLIGELGGLGFLDYALHATVPALMALGVTFVVVARVCRGQLVSNPDGLLCAVLPNDLSATERSTPRQAPPAAPGVDRWLLIKSLLAVLAVIVGMLLLDRHREIAALAVAAVLLAGRRIRTAELLQRVDWGLLVLIGSLFVVTAAFARLPLAAEGLQALTNAGLSIDRLSVLVPVAVVGSNSIGNVPLVMLLVETLGNLGRPSLIALAVFSTLAGNLLLIGSLANIITAERAAQVGVRLGFADFARVGIPTTLISTALAVGWLLLMGWSY